jgi:hypothetical protein
VTVRKKQDNEMREGFRYFYRLVGFAGSPLGAVLIWLSIGALLLICVAGLGGIRAAIVLVPSNIKPELEHAFFLTIGSRASLLLAVPSDDRLSALQGPSKLSENGHLLGPGEQLHQRIRDSGGGLYALNYSYLRFSTSDNSDPRTNKRTYRLDVPVTPGPLVWLATAFGLGLAAIRFIAARSSPQRVPISIKSAVTVGALTDVGTTGT